MLEYNNNVLPPPPASYKMYDDIYFIIMRLTRDQFDEQEKIGTSHIKSVGLLAMLFWDKKTTHYALENTVFPPSTHNMTLLLILIKCSI